VRCKGGVTLTVEHVVVTGGRGYLGGHLVRELVATGCTVTVVDLSPCPSTQHPNVTHTLADVSDRRTLVPVMAGADTVIHAAFSPPYATPATQRRVNVGGADIVCDAALTAGARRVVVLSSTIVDRRIRRHPLLRNAPISRLAAYAAARRDAEAIALSYQRRGLEVAVVRPKTFVGPGRVGGFALIFELMRRGDAIPLLGTGQARYQLVDVRDLATGVVSLAASSAEGVFGFGATRFGSILEDFEALGVHAGTGARSRPFPAVLGRAALRTIELAGLPPLGEWHYDVAGERDSIIDVSRAVSELDWHPRYSNSEALTDAYDWYVDMKSNEVANVTTHPIPAAHRAFERLMRAVLR
jgi:nucleoside-diphosphate-sugar epimerase